MAAQFGFTFAVNPAGEASATGELRPSLEDSVGAGAVIASLLERRSPEASLAALSFGHLRHQLPDLLRQTNSGKELIERRFSLAVDRF